VIILAFAIYAIMVFRKNTVIKITPKIINVFSRVGATLIKNNKESNFSIPESTPTTNEIYGAISPIPINSIIVRIRNRTNINARLLLLSPAK
jgi:hypothetical protein